MGLIRHRKLPIILIPVGEGDGEDVVARGGNVELRAVGRGERLAVDRGSRVGGDLHGHMADVLGEDDAERVAADGGLDGQISRGILSFCHFYGNIAITVVNICADRATPCRRKHKSQQQYNCFGFRLKHINKRLVVKRFKNMAIIFEKAKNNFCNFYRFSSIYLNANH